MAYPYIDTPRTEVDGNATYLTNGFRSVGRHNLSALDSVENSFQTPSKDEDVLKVLDAGRRLMRSAAKNNFLRNMSTARGNGHKTPAYMKEGRSNIHTPGLPSYDMTGIDEEDETDDQPTPLPQVASSSVQSTPLPGLSGLLNDGQNMTLKEQEKVSLAFLYSFHRVNAVQLTFLDNRQTRQG